MNQECFNGYPLPQEIMYKSKYFLAPVCERCELSWAINLASNNPSPRKITVTDGRRVWPETLAIKKQMGESTFLIATGEMAGFVAADLSDPSHLGFLHEGWGINTYPYANAFALRPFVPQPRMNLSAETRSLTDKLARLIEYSFPDQVPEHIKRILTQWKNENYTSALQLISWLLLKQMPDFPTDFMFKNSQKFLEQLKAI